MKCSLTFGMAALICCHVYSQSFENNWVFGDSSGLNFSTADPIFFTSSIITYESCASISNSEGNLFLYTDGFHVWNASNSLLENGDSLNIGQYAEGTKGSSVSQGVIIIPKPGESNRFYIFYISGYNDTGVSYSIADMNANSGYGKIILLRIPTLTALSYQKRMEWTVIRNYLLSG